MKNTEVPQALTGNLLLYLPWKFDMLGGVDVVVDRLWNGLEKRHPGMATIGIQDWEHHGDCTDAQGRRFLHLNFPAPPSTEGRLPLRYLITLARRLPSAWLDLKKRNITTVNFHFPTLNVYPLALLKRFGCWRGRIVLSFHGSDLAAIDPTSRFWQCIAEQTDAITACSAALARDIDALALFGQRVQVVHNGIDCEQFLAHANGTETGIHGRYLLNVGNYVPWKGQDVLLWAFAKIAPQHPELGLVYVGGTGNGVWLHQLQALSEELQISDRVVFLQDQPHKQVAALMREAVCLVHAAHKESFGLVLLEAAVCATPIIAPRVGGIPEIISAPELGLLFEDGNIDELQEAISVVLDYPDQAGQRASRLNDRVTQCFSSDTMVKAYVHIAAHA